MDVAAELVHLRAGVLATAIELLHGVVGRLDDAGRKKEAFDVVAFVEVERQVDDFFWGEKRARRMSELTRLTQKTQS